MKVSFFYVARLLTSCLIFLPGCYLHIQAPFGVRPSNKFNQPLINR